MTPPISAPSNVESKYPVSSKAPTLTTPFIYAPMAKPFSKDSVDTVPTNDLRPTHRPTTYYMSKSPSYVKPTRTGAKQHSNSK